MRTIVAEAVPASPARVHEPDRPTVRVALVQHRWREDPDELAAVLHEAIGSAARSGAQLVFLPEITFLRYPADALPTGRPDADAESIDDGPSVLFAREAARENDIHVHLSIFQRAAGPNGDDGLGYNTAIVVAPDGRIVARTHKMHIPVTAGYHEDAYFRPGPADTGYPVHPVDLPAGRLTLGLPTCWDEWFPEVARLYGIGGADVLCYPTAIGSEPDHPDFDTEPLWRSVIIGNAIANGLFMVVPNRIGDEGLVTFYGSSFIADPYGRVLVTAPRDEEAVLVADLDLAQRRDWLDLFPFFGTRRPDSYGALLDPIREQDRWIGR